MHFVLATANLISNSTVNYFSRAGKAGHTKVLSLEQPRIYRENPEQSLREHLKIWHISYKNEKLEPGEKKKKRILTSKLSIISVEKLQKSPTIGSG